MSTSDKKHISPWIPLSMLVITTAALTLPLTLLRRQRVAPSTIRSASSHPTPPPPIRRISSSSTGPLPHASLCASREDNFNGALYSLKAFSIATAIVFACGAASVWSVKTYLGVKDCEFASAMRLTLLTKWPLLTSKIHRASDSAPLPPSVSLTTTTPTAPPPHLPRPSTAVPDVDG
ncbi:hypothetical protein BGW80DRAFT_1375923, partial [Lactifluus volemus]